MRSEQGRSRPVGGLSPILTVEHSAVEFGKARELATLPIVFEILVQERISKRIENHVCELSTRGPFCFYR